jgi:signal transduction histidine kinase
MGPGAQSHGASEASCRQPDGARLAEQVRLLYNGSYALYGNLACAVSIAVATWGSFPPAWVAAWIGATGVVVLLRTVLWRRYRRAPDAREAAANWGRLFALGALSSALLWGAACAGLPFFGTHRDYLTFAIVGAGMTAAGLASLGVYLPAYFCYTLTFAFSLAAACIASLQPDLIAVGVLMLVYAGIVSVGAYYFNRSVRRTLELQIENAALNASLRIAAEELSAAEQDKWSAFAQLSHELRTPLNAILGFSESLRDEIFGPHSNRKYRDYAGDIHSSGQYLLALASDILDLSQSESGALNLSESDCNLAALVGDCVRSVSLLAAKRGIRLSQSVDAALPLLHADECKVHQILLNLLSNAIKFTSEGEVSVGAGLASDRAIVITVSDSGIGMSAADLRRAMMPFVRLANELTMPQDGAGLGLPLCKRLADLHGAELTIDSVPGAGTTCRVRFPPSRTGPLASTALESNDVLEVGRAVA